MTGKLFVHINFGQTVLHMWENLNEQDWWVQVIIDGDSSYNLTKSDFIRLPFGPHSATFIINYDRGANHELFMYPCGDQFIISENDVHYTININFLRDDSIDFLPGNIELDQEKGKPQGGCYVATAVYGSYDCPSVWTLRRFRDDILGTTWLGRVFIHTYYSISPTLVKWLGDSQWFKCVCQYPLDQLVNALRKKGIAGTPYIDKDWRTTK